MPTFTTNFSFFLPLVNDPIDEDIWGGQLNANWTSIDNELVLRTLDYDFAGNKLIDAKFEDLSERVNDLGNISGAVVVDYQNGHVQHAVVTGNITSLTINNLPPSGSGGFLLLELTQDGTGGWTIAVGSAFKIPGGALALSADPGALDRLTFTTRTAGTAILMSAENNFLSVV